MPSYKDEKTNTWYCKFYYTNWQGQKKQKLKRGFKLQREAKDFERKFLEQFAKNPDITFETLYKKYKEYIKPRIRESSASVKFSVISTHILPFFKDRVISDISPADIAAWQNGMLTKKLSDTYLRTASVQLTAMFNYAVEYVGLPKSPCKKPIGSNKAKNVNFWTPEEYAQFIDQCRGNIKYYTIFEILYYTGMRKGELLALTLNDIDFTGNKISINKTYYHIAGKDLINEPKTETSERIIDIPEFLTDEIKEYVSHLYKPDPEQRLFDMSAQRIGIVIKAKAQKAGVKQIRVHDLRHSHASMLINLGANPVLIAERLGHKSADITLRVYSHLFPHKQADIVQRIHKVEKEPNK
ncbi:site-specific integrase [Muricomes intestini]|uniref:site-specific integrase n=1 Tax=Muricomes intestini TaxID=1796634 RepID=UPI002FDE12F8